MNDVIDSKTQLQNWPKLDARIFPERHLEDIDWDKERLYVFDQVFRLGTVSDYDQLIRFYGRERIIDSLTKENLHLPHFRLDHIADHFGLLKKEL